MEAARDASCESKGTSAGFAVQSLTLRCALFLVDRACRGSGLAPVQDLRRELVRAQGELRALEEEESQLDDNIATLRANIARTQENDALCYMTYADIMSLQSKFDDRIIIAIRAPTGTKFKKPDEVADPSANDPGSKKYQCILKSPGGPIDVYVVSNPAETANNNKRVRDDEQMSASPPRGGSGYSASATSPLRGVHTTALPLSPLISSAAAAGVGVGGLHHHSGGGASSGSHHSSSLQMMPHSPLGSSGGGDIIKKSYSNSHAQQHATAAPASPFQIHHTPPSHANLFHQHLMNHSHAHSSSSANAGLLFPPSNPATLGYSRLSAQSGGGGGGGGGSSSSLDVHSHGASLASLNSPAVAAASSPLMRAHADPHPSPPSSHMRAAMAAGGSAGGPSSLSRLSSPALMNRFAHFNPLSPYHPSSSSAAHSPYRPMLPPSGVPGSPFPSMAPLTGLGGGVGGGSGSGAPLASPASGAGGLVKLEGAPAHDADFFMNLYVNGHEHTSAGGGSSSSGGGAGAGGGGGSGGGNSGGIHTGSGSMPDGSSATGLVSAWPEESDNIFAASDDDK